MASTIFKTSLFTFLFLALTGCSFFAQVMDKDSPMPKKLSKEISSKSCVNHSRSLLGQSSPLGADFNLFLQKLSTQKIATTFAERASMWILVQGFAHPQQASLSARLTYIIRSNQDKQYRDIKSSEGHKETTPVLFGIEQILKDNPSNLSLPRLAQLIDLYFPRSALIEKPLQKFVEENKKKLRQDPLLKAHYFRGKQTVKQDESIVLVPLQPFVTKYTKTKNRSNSYSLDTTLHSFTSPRIKADVLCNYDLNLYAHGVFLITPTVITALPIAYQEGQQLLLASLSQDTSNFSALGLGNQLRGDSSNGLRAALCLLDYNNFQMSVLSNKDRDPAQLLYEIFEKTGLSFSPQSIPPAIEKGRQLTLLNPLRAVVESDFIDEAELDRLNKDRIATYHYSPIGNIQIVFKDQKNQVTLFADGRNDNQLNCPVPKRESSTKKAE